MKSESLIPEKILKMKCEEYEEQIAQLEEIVKTQTEEIAMLKKALLFKETKKAVA